MNSNVLEVLKIMLAAGVASWGIYEYYSKEHANKIDRVQSYISEHVDKAAVITALDDFWTRNGVRLDWDTDLNAPSVDIIDWRLNKVTYERTAKLIAEDKEDAIRSKVHHLRHFYYNVAVCLNDDLCDLETTCDAFFGDILEYRVRLIEYLQEFETYRMIDKDTQIRDLLHKCKARQDRLPWYQKLWAHRG